MNYFLFSDFFYFVIVFICFQNAWSFKGKIWTHMGFHMSSYDNLLLSSTQQRNPMSALIGNHFSQEKQQTNREIKKTMPVIVHLLLSLPRRSQLCKNKCFKCFALTPKWWKAAEYLHVPLDINAAWKMESIGSDEFLQIKKKKKPNKSKPNRIPDKWNNFSAFVFSILCFSSLSRSTMHSNALTLTDVGANSPAVAQERKFCIRMVLFAPPCPQGWL